MNEPPENTSDTKWMGASLLAAVTASLCCITPVVAFVAGISGFASTFSWLEPFRPYLIGLTVILLGFAWYQKLKPQWDPDCECEENPSFWNTKKALGIVTFFVGLMLAFPYYSETIISTQAKEKQVVYVQKSQIKTIGLDINGMTCSGCEATVIQAAKEIDGVLDATASYQKGTATIKFDQSNTTRKDIIAAINKTGFTVKTQRNNKE